jgi:ATP/ADP translocase
MKESLKVLLSSKYVRDLATLVVAYGISINLVEVTWKSKLKAQVIFLNIFILIFRLCCCYGVYI